jgi:hypothetical protein
MIQQIVGGNEVDIAVTLAMPARTWVLDQRRQWGLRIDEKALQDHLWSLGNRAVGAAKAAARRAPA